MAYQSEIEKLEARFEEKPEQWFAALADAYRKNKDLDLALDILNTWLEKRPNYTSGHIVRARVLLDRGEDTPARAALERVLDLDAENIIALRALSEIAERAGDEPGAMSWLKRLLEVDPMNQDAEEAMVRRGAAGPQPAPPAPPPVPVPETPGPAEVTGFEPTTMAEPEAPTAPADEEQPGGEGLVIERASRTDLEATVPMEGLAVEESPELGTGGDAPAIDLGVDVESAPGDALPDADRASASEVSVVPEKGTADGGDLNLTPFDEPLAGGTGEPKSAGGPQEDVEEAEPAREESPAEAGGELDISGVSASSASSAPSAPSASSAGGEDGMGAEEDLGGDLSLIMPDGVSDPAEPEPPADDETEPVVTETMADLYAKQGHREQALEIYRQLSRDRPDDAGLREKIAVMEGRPAEPAEAQGFSVAATGGQSARDYLLSVLGGTALVGGPGEEAGSESPLDEAFGSESEPEGEPTRRASDDLSLGSVFGDEPETTSPSSASPASPASPAGDEGKGSGTGFSFDEFFGAGGSGEGGREAPPPEPDRPKQGGEGNFKDWLKGLKT